jgi:hypothetical protein
MRSQDEKRSLPDTKNMRAGLITAAGDEWVAGRTLVAYGVRVGVRANNQKYLARLLTSLSTVWRPSPAMTFERLFSLRIGTAGLRRNGRTLHQIFEDQQLIAMAGDPEEALDMVESQLKLYLAERARRRVFVHAGVVGWRGKAIVIPGRSYSGKTSLVAELVRAGATYYSDEYAVLDSRGLVHPYSTPLAIRKSGSYKQWRCPAEELGGRAGKKPLSIGLIIVSKFESGRRFRPQPLSPGRAMLELLANTLPARRKPEAVMATLQNAVTGAIGVKGARGEAAEAVNRIFDFLR